MFLLICSMLNGKCHSRRTKAAFASINSKTINDVTNRCEIDIFDQDALAKHKNDAEELIVDETLHAAQNSDEMATVRIPNNNKLAPGDASKPQGQSRSKFINICFSGSNAQQL